MVKGRRTGVGDDSGEPSEEGVKKGGKRGMGERREERIPVESSPRWLKEGGSWERKGRTLVVDEGEGRDGRGSPRALRDREGRSSSGQGYPPPRESHPLCASLLVSATCHLPSVLTPSPPLPSPLPCCPPPRQVPYFPTSRRYCCCDRPIDPCFLLLRGTFVSTASAFIPCKSLKET